VAFAVVTAANLGLALRDGSAVHWIGVAVFGINTVFWLWGWRSGQSTPS
jgi:hypothetical protein